MIKSRLSAAFLLIAGLGSSVLPAAAQEAGRRRPSPTARNEPLGHRTEPVQLKTGSNSPVYQRRIRPDASPAASRSISPTSAWLKSPKTECFQAAEATPKAKASRSSFPRRRE